eukprot:TRINITY_DN34130_c0_g1_i1.p1 TRINITY_DN34130_c0_g1~~TRINITY_DN34130_c0_g1_i1.p1  ORF type:complete len:362 (+),score=35.29 TRINITY_DN34130_c0_g1_i1:48-1133(+)
MVGSETDYHLAIEQETIFETPWGRFAAGKLISSGQNSKVWSGEHEETGAKVAMKIYKADVRCATAAVREASILKKVQNCRHTMRYFGFFLYPASNPDWAPHVVILSHLMDGSVLLAGQVGISYHKIQREARLPFCLTILRQVATALSDLHSMGLTHCDVKPENLLVGPTGVCLADFNNCCEKGTTALNNGVWEVGTLWYKSPELLNGSLHAVYPATDVWSLACVVGEVLCGGAPLFPVDVSLPVAEASSRMLWLIGTSLDTGPSTPTSMCDSDFSSDFVPFPTTAISYLFSSDVSALDLLLQDLLSAMLQSDPAIRPTCKQILKHPIFSHNPVEGCNGVKEGFFDGFKEENSQAFRSYCKT